MKSFNIAAYISGSGSNLRAVIESSIDGTIASKVKLVIADKEAKGLEYPDSIGIETAVISRKNLPRSEFLKRQHDLLKKHSIDLIILAGFLKKLPPEIVHEYDGKILNIHPALLPKFGGKGFYGMNVHRAVLEAGEEYSGPTVHFVDEKYDNGEILVQRKVKIDGNETPESLQNKVLKEEHTIFTEAIKILEERE
ncbi:MAG TPA: phosphoribosylglycinamide formyltransferase [Clostridiales bacterium]|nr:phosphoribosylglycinamide formyltransferase [Clostridiales bacterium]